MENNCKVSDYGLDVLLICPNYHSEVLITDAVVYPINLAALAAYLREKGISVEIIDGRALNFKLSDYDKSIRKLRPKIVGITVMSSYVNQAVEISNVAKNISADITVIAGGAHISALPYESLMNYETFDIAVVGEGEETLYELSLKILRGEDSFGDVRGIYFREKGEIKSTGRRDLVRDLDPLPYPAFDLLDLEKYRPSINWVKKRPFLMIYTARGCPFKCTFCASNVNFGRTVRYRSAESIVDELEFYKEKYSIRQIIFYDDTLVLNKKHINALCDLMIERNTNLTWCCFSTVEAMSLELAKKMKKAGCFMIFFGLESGSEYMLRRMNKNYKSVKLAKKVLSDVKSAGITPIGSFIFGHPGETRETMEATLKFALELPLGYATFAILVPFPGSEIFDYARNKGILPESIVDWGNFELYAEPYQLSEVPIEEVVEFTKMAYRRFYLRPKTILRIVKDSVSVYKFWHGFLTGVRILRLMFQQNFIKDRTASS